MTRLALLRLCAALLIARLGATQLLATGIGATTPILALLLATAVALGLAILLGRVRRRRRRTLICCGLLAALGATALLELDWRPAPAAPRACLTPWVGSEQLWLVQGQGYPVRTPYGPQSTVRLAARLAGGRWMTQPGGPASVRLTGARVLPGDWLLVRGRFELWPVQRNPAAADRAANAWRRRRSVGRLRLIGPWAAAPLEVPGGAGWSGRWAAITNASRCLAGGWRERAGAVLDRRLPAPAAGLARAMTIGDRSRLAPEIAADFRHLGWSHLLALSGLHVGFVAGLARALLHLGRVRRTGSGLAVLLIGYAWLTGASPSVVRATLMGLGALAARALCRPLDTGRALGWAALCCLVWAPGWLADPGALLSFSAVGGIVLLGPSLDLTRPLASAGDSAFGRWVLAPLRTGCAAQLGCLPVLAATFHAVSPWGVLTGPLAIPLAALGVAATLLGLLADLLVPPLGNLLLDGAAVAVTGLIALARSGATRLPAPWPVATPGAVVLLVFAVGAVLLGRRRLAGVGGSQGSAAISWLGGLLLVGAVCCVLLPPPELGCRRPVRIDLELLDVGQGDAMLLVLTGSGGWLSNWGLRPPPQSVVLIDAGDCTIYFDAGARVVVPRLQSLGLRRLVGAILTHADRDHVGGMAAVLAALPVTQIWVPAGFESPAPLARALARRPATRLTSATSGDTLFAWPGGRLIALHPPPGYRGNPNDGSLVVAAELSGCRLLLTGDVEAAGEQEMLAGGTLAGSFDILKVGHHGSSSSSTPPFLNAVGATTALISAGAGNRFGHPDPRVVSRLRRRAMQVWRTDQRGAVRVEIESGGWRVTGTVPVTNGQSERGMAAAAAGGD